MIVIRKIHSGVRTMKNETEISCFNGIVLCTGIFRTIVFIKSVKKKLSDTKQQSTTRKEI